MRTSKYARVANFVQEDASMDQGNLNATSKMEQQEQQQQQIQQQQCEEEDYEDDNNTKQTFMKSSTTKRIMMKIGKKYSRIPNNVHDDDQDEDDNNNNQDYDDDDGIMETISIESSQNDNDNDSDNDSNEIDLLKKKNTRKIQIPNNYICPLTLQIMNDPVTDLCGHTYERIAILEWIYEMQHFRHHCHDLEKNQQQQQQQQQDVLTTTTYCPISRKPLSIHGLQSDTKLQLRIQQWKQQHNNYYHDDLDHDNDNNHFLQPNQHQTKGQDKGDTTTTLFIPENNNLDEDEELGICSMGTPSTKPRMVELMLLPQERKALEIIHQKACIQRKRDRRRRQCRSIGWNIARIAIALVLIILYFLVPKHKQIE